MQDTGDAECEVEVRGFLGEESGAVGCCCCYGGFIWEFWLAEGGMYRRERAGTCDIKPEDLESFGIDI
jgi:hypothetical protein